MVKWIGSDHIFSVLSIRLSLFSKPNSQIPTYLQLNPSMSVSAVSTPAVSKVPNNIPSVKIQEAPEQKTGEPAENSDEEVDDTNRHPHSHADYDVLDALKNRQSDAYRNLTFQIPAHFNPVKKNYRKRVSFDTVNLGYDDDDDGEGPTENKLLEELAKEEARRRSRFDNLTDYMFEIDRGRDRSISPNRAASPLMYSPGNSTSPLRMLSPALSPTRGMVKSPRGSVFGRNSLYPTTPIITQPSCNLTKTHKDFDALYKGTIPGMKPVLPGRVIMVYISGRKHTWVALDWVLRSFVENGDTVVIVGVLGSVLENLIRNRGLSPAKIVAQTPKMRYKLRSHPQYTKIITRNILNYAFQILNPDAIVRVVADMTVGKPKDVIKAMYLLYTPNIVVTGGKISTTVGAPLRSWTSSKITDRLVKNFPLPVIVVPAMTMSYFELGLKKDLEDRDFDEEQEEKNLINRKKSVKKLMTDSKGNLLPCIRPESALKETNHEENDDEDDPYSSSSSSEDEEELTKAVENEEEEYDGRVLPRLDEDALSKHLQAKVGKGTQSAEADETRSRRSKRSSFSSRSKRSSLSSRSKDSGNANESSDSDPESDSDEYDYSDHSSIASSDTYDSYREISDLYLDYKDEINQILEEREKKPMDADAFLSEIKAISDKSAQLCREFKEVNPSFSGKGSKLAREITGSNKFGEVPFKTKSLLEPVEPKPKLVQSSTTPSYSFKEIQRRMKEQQRLDELQLPPPVSDTRIPLTKGSSVPQISITGLPGLSPMSSGRSPSPQTVVPPKSGSLKFADSVNSSRPKKSIYSTTSKLTKALSHEIDTDNRFTLEPSKSHPDLTVVLNPPEKEKKKKKKGLLKFWK